MEKKMAILKLSSVKLDGGTQFRESINQDTVKEYKELMLDDVVFKPVEVTFDGEFYYLVDGFHRYFAVKAMGVNTIEAKVTEGTLQDAIRRSRGVNNDHGMPRSYETKRRVVTSALKDPENDGVSAREIARECRVSHTFVLDITKSLKGGSASTKTEKPEGGSASTPREADANPPLTQDFSPSDEELEANQMMIQHDIETMNKMLESDDVIATLHAEVKRLNTSNANLQSRLNALMREKDAAVDLLKKAQRELDRIKKAKK
jgi:hypothetical protein